VSKKTGRQEHAAVMQPYFFPYIGYFQLIQNSRFFVILDDVQFIKGGWVHKNKILDRSGREFEISIPTMKPSSRSLISSLEIHENFSRLKTLTKIERCYRRANYFREAMDIIEPLVMFESNSMVHYLENSIKGLSKQLGADTKFVRASELAIGNPQTPHGRIIEVCKNIQCNAYLNLPGGRKIYAPSDFESEGISLSFLSPEIIEYEQFTFPFIGGLSILDTLMHSGLEATAEMTKKGRIEANV
jgi:hypothetical protein